jgi:hypothetical protein
MPSASAVLAGALAAAASATAAHPVLTFHDPAITESSGLGRSGRHAGVLWTHNDGGQVADIYGVDGRGHTVTRLRLRGIDPYDPEALAPGRDAKGRPALFLGDTGDNLERRPDVSVFRVTEPRTLGEHTVDPTWYRFRYPDGSHDAEALLVDPRDGRLWIATKSFGADAGLYRAPRRLVEQADGTNRLTRVADVPPLVTDGAFLSNGDFVLRTYTTAYVYDRPGHVRDHFELPLQQQGESIAFDRDRLLIGSEGLHSEVLAVPLPTDVTPSPSRSTATSRPADDKGFAAGDARWWGIGAAAAVVLLIASRAVRRRRRP